MGYGLFEEAIRSSAASFGSIHSDIGIADKLIEARPVFRIKADPHARGQMDIDALCSQGSFKRRDDFRYRALDLVDVFYIRQDQDKFIAAESAHYPTLCLLAKAFADLHENLVAAIVP